MKMRIDYSRMQEELNLAPGFQPRLEEVWRQVQAKKNQGELGFSKLPYQQEELIPVLDLAQAVRDQFRNVVVIGIGGSDLGTRAVHRALNHQFYNLLGPDRRTTPRLFFLGDTTDPVAIKEVLDVLDLKETAFITVSKSGNTIEQMSVFTYVRRLLLDQLGEEATRERLIVVTDANSGTLRDIDRREGYRSLPFPSEVGGRFSVLSSAALFPLAVVGIDIHRLLDGAMAMDRHDRETSASDNWPARYALLQYLAYEQGRPISVFMPYTYSLREVGFWYRQLWAESLGKKYNLDGHLVNIGPTPIASIGPTDQHSQVQLYMEGPTGKVFTFVTVRNPSVNMTLPEAYADLEGVSYLKGHDFNEILLAEQKSTACALQKEGRPSMEIELDCLDEESMGELLYFFELAVTYAGELFKINTFDQPGVELGKKIMYGILGRPGFEEWKV